MTRSTARELAMHCSFSLGFLRLTAVQLLEERLSEDSFNAWKDEDDLYEEYPDQQQQQYITQLVEGVGDHGPELDSYIGKYAVNWKFERIPRTASAIMRVAMYEILYMPEIPNAAAINEAVEIAKKYEEAKTVSFVNGILGSFLRAEFPEEYGSLPEVQAETMDMEEVPEEQAEQAEEQAEHDSNTGL